MQTGISLLGYLLLPPAILIFSAFLGLFLNLRWRTLGGALLTGSLVLLLSFSLPVSAYLLIIPLESTHPALNIDTIGIQDRPRAIVVLGGGRYADAVEYHGDTVDASTLQRLRYAVHLHKQSGLPLLLSGGGKSGEKIPEAKLMETVLTSDFKLQARWLETSSRSTYENAMQCKQILLNQGIRRIYLVTHAWHMPRAVWSFEHAGFRVTPAPTAFTTLTLEDRSLLGYTPTARGLYLSSLALRERLGLAWYKMRY